jgi:hypothetical protein
MPHLKLPQKKKLTKLYFSFLIHKHRIRGRLTTLKEVFEICKHDFSHILSIGDFSCFQSQTKSLSVKSHQASLKRSEKHMSRPIDTIICTWKAKFNVHPEKIIVSRVVNLPNVTLITEIEGENTKVISIEITTPNLPFVDAVNYSKVLANRCVDIMSFIVGYGVSCFLNQINEISNETGKSKTGMIFLTGGAFIAKPVEIDITKSSFTAILQNTDAKLTRQLAHYRRGISSQDVIEQIREFYLVLEDEYGKNSPRLQPIAYIRHLVSHPELNSASAKRDAITLLGKTYLDPSAPNDLSTLRQQLENIKNEAKCVIEAKI